MDKAEKRAFIFAHIAIFIIFVWFGGLKVFGYSPASPLVGALLNVTMPFFTEDSFIFWFGLFEVLIGALFLIPKAEKIAISLLILHMATTIMPLLVLPHLTWTAPFVPTLEGQYIIKNIIIIALVATVFADARKIGRC